MMKFGFTLDEVRDILVAHLEQGRVNLNGLTVQLSVQDGEAWLSAEEK